MENVQDKIDEIMDCFDFEKVARVMEFLGWQWASINGVPDVTQIRKAARQLLREVSGNGKWARTSTGGFIATKENNELSLVFYVSQWETGE